MNFYHIWGVSPGNAGIGVIENVYISANDAQWPSLDLTQVPYPLVVEVTTSAGAKVLTTPHPVAVKSGPLTVSQLIAELEAEAQAEAACELATSQPAGYFNPIWIPDPPNDPNASVIVEDGPTLAATVQLVGYGFAWTGPAITLSEGQSAFEAPRQQLTFSGTAEVQIAGRQPFLAAFSTPVTLDLSGQLLPGFPGSFAEVSLEQSATVSVSATIPASAISQPANLDPTLDFSITIPTATTHAGMKMFGMLPVTVECSCGRSPCGAACVDLDHDSANCGACGVRCAPGSECREGTCEGSCGH
jgi:hypothetical protein